MQGTQRVLELTVVPPKRIAEAMAPPVFPPLASQADLEKAVSDITLRLIGTITAVAGLAIVVAKAL
jgi:hypothetical protein